MSLENPFRALPISFGAQYRAKARRKRLNSAAWIASMLLVAASVGGLFGIASGTGLLPVPTFQMLDPLGCRATDGDSIRCGSERIRLLAIDAPELPGHCRRGRTCAPGDPYASAENLKRLLNGEIAIKRVGTDRYGRTLAQVSANGVDLSCAQLADGQAIYIAKWDNDGRIAFACPETLH